MFLKSLLYLTSLLFVFHRVQSYFLDIAEKILEKHPEMSRIIVRSGFSLLGFFVFCFFLSVIVSLVLRDFENYTFLNDSWFGLWE